MADKRTIKALESGEDGGMAIAALDAASEEEMTTSCASSTVSFADAHMEAGRVAQRQLEDLGGAPIAYEVGSGKGQATLWAR